MYRTVGACASTEAAEGFPSLRQRLVSRDCNVVTRAKDRDLVRRTKETTMQSQGKTS